MEPINKPQVQNFADFLYIHKNKVETYPEVDRRWYIEEYTPPKCIDHHWDDWEYGGWSRVSGFTFNSKDAAEDFVAQHNPSDPKGKLRIREEVLREVTEQKWFPY